MDVFSLVSVAAEQFKIDGPVSFVRNYGSGNINSTFMVATTEGTQYILQKINTNVFSKPFVLM